EKDVESVESSEQNSEEVSEEENEEDTEETEEESEELDQTLVDNDNLKAVVTGIKKIEDKEWDEERYEISIEIDNKRDDTIEVKAHETYTERDMSDGMVMLGVK